MLYGVEPRMPTDVSLDAAPPDCSVLTSKFPLNLPDAKEYLHLSNVVCLLFAQPLMIIYSVTVLALNLLFVAGRTRTPLTFEPG